ncbi:MAG: HEAT repeat domain-containing protein [Methylosarcina sp.]
MINRRVAIAVLAVTLAACGDGEKEDDKVNNNQKLFQKALQQDTHRISKTPELNAQSQKQESTQKDLSQMAMDEAMIDQASDIEELEEYRQDYEEAADVEEKSEALIALVQADEKNAVALLQEAYESPDPELRREAVLQLQDFSDDTRAVELMLKALDDPDSEVVMNAVEGLSGQESGRVMEKLKKVAQSHSDESVREAAQDYLDQANELGQ